MLAGMAYAMNLTIPILWGDMDALGHVNNVRFFRWFESARIALFERLGWDPEGGASGVGPILATATCDFLAPVVYPGDVVVGLNVTKVGTTSITMEYGLWRVGDPDRLLARGSSVVVLVEYATGSKIPLPQEMRVRLSAL
jgi:acyl-CoA thioester hydrolase